MKNIKKLLAIFFVTAISMAFSGSIAYAAEDISGDIQLQGTSVDTNVTDAVQNTQASDNTTDATYNTQSGQTLTDSAADAAAEAPAADSAEYETYVDEQGEVYYVDKEPEAPVIVDQKEDTSENTEAAKDNKDEKPSYSEKDLRLLAGLVYAEAGNQSYNGMLAVANVVLNRLDSEAYSYCKSVKDVIYDHKWGVQFAVTIKSSKTGLSMLDKALKSYDTGKYTGSNPEAEKKAMNKAIKAAKAALEGENNIGSFLNFNSVNSHTSSIKKNYHDDYKIIGDQIFYRSK